MADFTKFNAHNDTATPFDAPRRTKGNLADLAKAHSFIIEGGYRFHDGTYGPYATFHVLGDLEHVYYANKPITRALKMVSDNGMADEIETTRVRLVPVTANIDDHAVTYYDLEFVPADE